MKNQALFTSKDKGKKLKCRLLQFSFGALRVKKYVVITSIARTETQQSFLIDKCIAVGLVFKRERMC